MPGITDFLRRENCLCGLSAGGKEDAVRELCALLAANGDIADTESVYDAVKSRELLGSTGIGDEIAIPHAKTASVKSLSGAFGLSREGVEFYSADGKPAKLVFLLVSSENGAGEHLKALARVARLVRRPSFRERAATAKDADELYAVISSEDAELG